MTNEFASSETFEESQLDALTDNTPPELLEQTQAFEAERNSILGIEEVDEENKPWQLTQDEFNAIVEKANSVETIKSELQTKLDKVFGTIGQMQSDMKQFKSQPQAVKVTKEQFARLTDYFGDESLAEALAEDLGELTLHGQSQSFDENAFSTVIEQKLSAESEKIRQEVHKDLLTAIHPDWQEVTIKLSPDGKPLTDEQGLYIHTDDFAAWHKSLSPEAQSKALNANDAPTVIRVLNEFKSWVGKKAEFEQKKTKRLEDAMPIKSGSSGRNTANNESPFNAELQRILSEKGI